VPRNDYWVGVPEPGRYRKILDSDATRFGGSGYSVQERIEAESEPSHGYPCRLRLDLPPLAAVFFEPAREH
jgi:1,4-alpha-glucan branching enzyme